MPTILRPLRRLAALAAACLLLTVSAAAARPVALPAAAGGPVRIATGAASVALPATPGLAIENVAGTADRWVAAGTVPGGLAVFAGDGGRATRLPAPPASRAPLLSEPLPLLDDGGALAGLAWLEGDGARSAAVRFARWDGLRWEAPVTVSAPGPGSQLALAAAALADGTLLLAWSAFDGADDEVLWSAWDGRAWSRPARLAADNAVPDVTPALAAVDGGALAAWARFDGESYTVVAARFAAGGWSVPVPVAPSGTAFPSLEPAAAGARLVARSALPRGWLVVDLDGDGRPARRALAAAATAARPLVEDAGGAVTLAWPGRDLPPAGAPWEPARTRTAP